MFCVNCGAVLNQGEKFCTECGTPIGGGYRTVYNSYKPNLIRQLSDKVKIMGIVWLVVGILQVLIGFLIMLAGGETFSAFMMVVGGLNIWSATQDLSYSNTVINEPVGVVEKFEPLGSAITTLVYNVVIGAVFGVAGSIYYFYVRNFVLSNAQQFNQIEMEYRANSFTV